MPDSLEHPSLSSRYLFFVVFALLWIYFRRNSSDYFINAGFFEVFIAVFIFSAGQGIIWYSRYSLSHVTVNGHHGSIFGRPRFKTDIHGFEWAIFSTGYSLYPAPFDWKLSTLIVPANQLNKAGLSYVARTVVHKYPLLRLPHAVYKMISEHSNEYNLKNIYYGYTSEEFVHKDPSIVKLNEEKEALQYQINLYSDVIEGKNDVLVGEIKKAEELTGNKKTIITMVKDIFNKQQQDNSVS